MTKPTLPYVRLYRREEGSFAQLPLMTRALANGVLLKMADDDGVIHLGRREPHEAVCFAAGAERTERKSVRRHVELLLADGYLVHDPATRTMRIPSFPRIEATPQRGAVDASTEPRRSVVEPSTDLQRGDVGASTEPQCSVVGASTELQHEAKCPESHDPPLRELREEIRKGSELDHRATGPRRLFDPGEYHELHPVVAAILAEFGRVFREATGRAYVRRGHGDILGAGRLAHWAELDVAANGGDAVELAARVTRHFVEARARGAQPPAMSWLDPDSPRHPLNPEAWRTTSDARPAKTLTHGPRAVSPAHRHSAEAAAAGPLFDDTGDEFDVEVAE